MFVIHPLDVKASLSEKTIKSEFERICYKKKEDTVQLILLTLVDLRSNT